MSKHTATVATATVGPVTRPRLIALPGLDAESWITECAAVQHTATAHGIDASRLDDVIDTVYLLGGVAQAHVVALDAVRDRVAAAVQAQRVAEAAEAAAAERAMQDALITEHMSHVRQAAKAIGRAVVAAGTDLIALADVSVQATVDGKTVGLAATGATDTLLYLVAVNTDNGNHEEVIALIDHLENKENGRQLLGNVKDCRALALTYLTLPHISVGKGKKTKTIRWVDRLFVAQPESGWARRFLIASYKKYLRFENAKALHSGDPLLYKPAPDVVPDLTVHYETVRVISKD